MVLELWRIRSFTYFISMSCFHAGRRKMNIVMTGVLCQRECWGTLNVPKQMVILFKLSKFVRTNNVGLLVFKTSVHSLLLPAPPLADISCYPQPRPPPLYLLPPYTSGDLCHWVKIETPFPPATTLATVQPRTTTSNDPPLNAPPPATNLGDSSLLL